jgi:hypothetical protein
LVNGLLALLFSTLLVSPAFAQGQSGKFTPGHALKALTPNGAPYSDAGGATPGASTNYVGLTELGITNTGTPSCINDAATNAPGGYHQLCFGANSLGGGLLSYNAVGGAAALPFQFIVNGAPTSLPGSVTGIPIAATNTALKALSTAANSSVLRVGVYLRGDAPPLLYNASASPCSLNSGAGDNGSQVQSVNGTCWLAAFPAEGIDARQYGYKASGLAADATANLAALNAAFSYWNGFNGFSGGAVLLPAGTGYVNGTINMGTAQSNSLIGAGKIATSLATTADATILTLNGPRDIVQGILFQGYGSPSTNQFPGGTQPVINMQNNCVDCEFWNIYVTGGTGITLAGADFVVAYSNVLYSYGAQLVDITGVGYLVRDKLDQPFPVSQPAFGSQNPSAWQATNAYGSVGTIVTNQGFWLQLKTAGTSGGSQPTLKAYEVDIPDGTAVWRLVAPTNMSLAVIEAASSVMNILDSDFSGASQNGLISNGASVQVLHSTFGQQFGSSVQISGGAGFNISNSQLASGVGTTSEAIQIISGGTFNGAFQAVDNLIWNYGAAGIDVAKSTQHLIQGNQICGMSKTGGVGVHIAAGITDFTINGNQVGTCPAWGANYNGIVIDTGASDYYVITNNLVHGATNQGVADSGSGTHKTVSGNQ